MSILTRRHRNDQQVNIKMCVTSIVIRKIQIKTTRRYLTPDKMAIFKTKKRENVG